MALTADFNPNRRGAEGSRNEFGYPPAAGAVIYRGALLALTSAGTLQPLQTSGSVVFAGLSDRASNTVAQPVVQAFIVAKKGTWGLTVPGATAANINAPVYATDDGTCTLTAGSNLQIGVLSGIDTGQTFVNLLGS